MSITLFFLKKKEKETHNFYSYNILMHIQHSQFTESDVYHIKFSNIYNLNQLNKSQSQLNKLIKKIHIHKKTSLCVYFVIFKFFKKNLTINQNKSFFSFVFFSPCITIIWLHYLCLLQNYCVIISLQIVTLAPE